MREVPLYVLLFLAAETWLRGTDSCFWRRKPLLAPVFGGRNLYLTLSMAAETGGGAGGDGSGRAQGAGEGGPDGGGCADCG